MTERLRELIEELVRTTACYMPLTLRQRELITAAADELERAAAPAPEGEADGR